MGALTRRRGPGSLLAGSRRALGGSATVSTGRWSDLITGCRRRCHRGQGSVTTAIEGSNRQQPKCAPDAVASAVQPPGVTVEYKQ